MSSKFPPKIVCFMCGVEKGSSNHWHLISTYVETVYVGLDKQVIDAEHPMPTTQTQDVKTLKIASFNKVLAEEQGQHPVCGNNCVQKVVERWLLTRTIHAPRGPAADPI